jgi:hypothetical protein
VRCCSLDPERQERLRTQARRGARTTVLPMMKQLAMPYAGSANAEAQLARLCEGREGMPRGMSRLVG